MTTVAPLTRESPKPVPATGAQVALLNAQWNPALPISAGLDTPIRMPGAIDTARSARFVSGPARPGRNQTRTRVMTAPWRGRAGLGWCDPE